jgi:C4-type Zn-finger protein
MNDIEKCPVCDDHYLEGDKKILYHVTYKPEVTTYTCRGCNYAEFLIRHPEIKTDYKMKRRKEIVRRWTLKNRDMLK